MFRFIVRLLNVSSCRLPPLLRARAGDLGDSDARVLSRDCAFVLGFTFRPARPLRAEGGLRMFKVLTLLHRVHDLRVLTFPAKLDPPPPLPPLLRRCTNLGLVPPTRPPRWGRGDGVVFLCFSSIPSRHLFLPFPVQMAFSRVL